METVINSENRNLLVKKVISGEVSVEKATKGLARIEVKIFYRKIDRAIQTISFQQSQSTSDTPIYTHKVRSRKNYTFPKEAFGPFRTFAKFKTLVV